MAGDSRLGAMVNHQRKSRLTRQQPLDHRQVIEADQRLEAKVERAQRLEGGCEARLEDSLSIELVLEHRPDPAKAG